ncbi:uncharacterized protein LOC141918445 [Strix aluco]|uniref:uncharacterized protein LOC141918445 n=1 Tax=Strix aluco TaxID=111821 RepID=UPI003DA4D892
MLFTKCLLSNMPLPQGCGCGEEAALWTVRLGAAVRNCPWSRPCASCPGAVLPRSVCQGPAAWQELGSSPQEHFFPGPGTATSGFVALPLPGWTPAFSLGDVHPWEMSTRENRSIPAPALQRSPRVNPGHWKRTSQPLMGTCLITAVPEANGHLTAQPDLLWEDQGDPTDVAGGDGYAASQLGSRADAQGDRMNVGTGRTFPDSQLDPALELPWHRRGMDRESVEKEAFWEGGSQVVPTSYERTGAIQSMGVPGMDGKRRANAADPTDFRKYCMEGAAAILGSMLLGMVFFCVIHVWRKIKWCLAEALRS